MKNPYRPGVGLQPAHLAGRDGQIRRFRSILASAPEIPANLRITGLRGVGKTVLLRRFEEVAREEQWQALMLELEPRHNTDERLTALLSGHLERVQAEVSTVRRVRRALGGIADTARRAVTVSFEGFAWSLGGDLATRTTALAQLLGGTVDECTRAGRRGLVLMFDEAQVLADDKDSRGRGQEHPLSMLLAAISALQGSGTPIALVLCGLPTLTLNLLDARTYAERMFRGDEVAPLPDTEARQAFLVPLEGTGRDASPGLVDRVMSSVEGYPYFVQLWGAELWDAATAAGTDSLTEPLLDEVEDDIVHRLDFDFYSPRVDSLTPAEQDLLGDAALCDYPPLLVSQLAERSTKSPGNVNVLLGRLVRANVVYRQGKGRYYYTAPGFDTFLERRASRRP